jgi:hypothetical protein
VSGCNPYPREGVVHFKDTSSGSSFSILFTAYIIVFVWSFCGVHR